VAMSAPSATDGWSDRLDGRATRSSCYRRFATSAWA